MGGGPDAGIGQERERDRAGKPSRADIHPAQRVVPEAGQDQRAHHAEPEGEGRQRVDVRGVR